jgi:hypothetical protein
MTSSTPSSQRRGGMNLTRIVLIVTGVLIGLVLLLFFLSLLISRGDVEQWGTIIELVRDLVIIFLALEGILIILALSVLIVQVARLINLLQNEVKPVLQNTRETMQSAKGTVDFVGDTVSRPLIKASAFMAGVGSLVGNVGGIRTALKKTAEDAAEQAEEALDGR